MTDTAATRPYGVLGRVLGHSYTPTIYKELAGLEYVRFEREPEDLQAFMTGDEWEGTNVTIPYKRAVMDYLDELSPLAERMGNVNTITRLPDGRLRGDNTDYFGFRCLVEELGVEVAGKKALVLGATGGAGTTASMVLGDMGAIVVPVGRTSEVNYSNIAQQSRRRLLVNCTPAGMFPHCPDAPCTLEGLDALEGVIDIVYNPARTGLMLEAERRGIPCIGGLLMLVAQAAQAVERYTGKATPRERILDVTERLSRREQNIALIGMPGSGKTRVASRSPSSRAASTSISIAPSRSAWACPAPTLSSSAARRPSASRRRQRWPTSPSAAAWCSPPAAAWLRATRTTLCCTKTAKS